MTFLGGVQARLRVLLAVLGVVVAVVGLSAQDVSAHPGRNVRKGVAAINLEPGIAIEPTT